MGCLDQQVQDGYGKFRTFCPLNATKQDDVIVTKNILVGRPLGWVENAPNERYQKSTSEYMRGRGDAA